MNDEKRWGTHETGAGAKDCVGREGMHNIDDRSEPLEQFSIPVLEFIKRPVLFLKYIKNKFGTVAAIDPVSKWVDTEIIPSLLGVVFQGCI
jgi:hypothetical protein